MFAPFRHCQLGKSASGVGMMCDGFIQQNRLSRFAAADAQPDAHRTLMQIGAPVRTFRGKTHHRHDRVALKHDDTDVRHSLITEIRKDFWK